MLGLEAADDFGEWMILKLELQLNSFLWRCLGDSNVTACLCDLDFQHKQNQPIKKCLHSFACI